MHKLTKAERELGELLHTRTGPIQPLIDASGFSKNYCYVVLRRYREQMGLPVRDGRGAPLAQLPFEGVVVHHDGKAEVKLRQENRDLREQLDHAHTEVATLQKIVMLLGEKL